MKLYSNFMDDGRWILFMIGGIMVAYLGIYSSVEIGKMIVDTNYITSNSIPGTCSLTNLTQDPWSICCNGWMNWEQPLPYGCDAVNPIRESTCSSWPTINQTTVCYVNDCVLARGTIPFTTNATYASMVLLVGLGTVGVGIVLLTAGLMIRSAWRRRTYTIV
jgi:hypothetical protein